MTPEEVLELCRQNGAYLEGHFLLSSGLHSQKYLQCALVLAHPAIAERMGRALAERCPGRPLDFVTAPAMGGLIIGHEVARAFGCPFLFTERDASSGRMALRRGFTLAPGARGIVVEDVITTGGSTRETIAAIATAGGTIVGAGSIIDRSGGSVDLGLPRVALATLTVETWPAEACPLCAAGHPLVKPGSRKSGASQS